MLDLKLERGRIDKGRDGLTITIPAPGRVQVRLLLLAWVTGWGLIGGEHPFRLWRPNGLGPPHGNVLVWGGALLSAGYVMLWNFFGREVVRLNATTLTVVRQIFGTAVRTRRYEVVRMRGLRADVLEVITLSDLSQGEISGTGRAYGVTGWSVAFQYDGKPQRFGINLVESDARIIVAHMNALSPVAESAGREPLVEPRARVIERGRGMMILIPPARDTSVTAYSIFFLFVASVGGMNARPRPRATALGVRRSTSVSWSPAPIVLSRSTAPRFRSSTLRSVF
jgi:hypothetical protein